MSRTLLVVHHTSSPNVQAMLEAVLSGTRLEGLEDIRVVTRPALSAGVKDVLDADGYILGTPANIGYLSGAMKYFFDEIYYPCLAAKVGAPYGLYVHGNNATEGAISAGESIVHALGWRRVHLPVSVVGEPSRSDLEDCRDLGSTVAAALLP